MRELLAKVRLEPRIESAEVETIFWLVLFLCLNVVDAVFTNRAFAMLESVGLDGKMAEFNPMLQVFSGSWLLALKGIPAVIIMALASRFLKVSMKRMLRWACVALAVVCIWNAVSIGLI